MCVRFTGRIARSCKESSDFVASTVGLVFFFQIPLVVPLWISLDIHGPAHHFLSDHRAEVGEMRFPRYSVLPESKKARWLALRWFDYVQAPV